MKSLRESAHHSNLPRLERHWYQGPVAVLWTHTVADRQTGWLTERFHAAFREILLHACVRYSFICPAYTLMPDHFHLIGLGLPGRSDQRLAAVFLRRHLGPFLEPARLQDRPHDHVLRDGEREHGAFAAVCQYVRENAVRAGLCTTALGWPYAGAVVPGYPDLRPNSGMFWETFWKAHNRLVGRRNDKSAADGRC